MSYATTHPDRTLGRARGLAAIAETCAAPSVLRSCRHCGQEALHKVLPCGRPRAMCVSCRRDRDAAIRNGTHVPRSQRPRRDAGRPPRRAVAGAPELGKAVVLDCDPPLPGLVERVDLNRGLAYVRTAYGVLPYGFAEIKRGRG